MSLGSIGETVATMLLCAFLCCGAQPSAAREFTDAAGRLVVLADQIERIMPAGPSADVLAYALAPRKIVAWSIPRSRALVLARGGRLPVMGRLTGPTPTAGPETVIRLHPDVVIDAGLVTPERAVFADRMQQRTGIPYILVDDSFARMPGMLRALGVVLGVVDRADDLASYAEHAVAGLRGRLLIRPADQRPRVYYGAGPSGLETGLPGSPAGEAIDQAGAINVAGALGRDTRTFVTREQIMEWNPEIIIAENRSFYDALTRSPGWRGVAAVRAKKVYLMPTEPFGWIDEPTGVNRLIGLYWLSGLLYPDPTQDDMHTVAPEFYEKFYGIKLTANQLEAMLRPAGVPPIQNPMATSLLGTGPLGRMPGSIPGSIPGSTPGSAPAGTPVAPSMMTPPGSLPMTGPEAITGLPGSPRPRRQPTSALPQ